MPPAKRLGRPRATELRSVLDAILYIARTGCQWRMLPIVAALGFIVPFDLNSQSRSALLSRSLMPLLLRSAGKVPSSESRAFSGVDITDDKGIPGFRDIGGDRATHRTEPVISPYNSRGLMDHKCSVDT
jgi:Putative transposase of IS4/5 family (DUF4096)